MTMTSMEIVTLLSTLLLSFFALFVMLFGALVTNKPKQGQSRLPAIFTQYVILTVATLFVFYQLSLKDPYFGYGWHVTGLYVWYTFVLFILQPLFIKYNQKKKDYWAS